MQNHKTICERIMRLAGRIRAEAIITSVNSSLTRFADNVISQNVSNASTEISVRVLENGRVTRFSLNQPSESALKTAFAAALAALRTQKKDPRLMPLPEPGPSIESTKLYFHGTAAMPPKDRAARVAAVIKKCRKAGAVAYGAYETGSTAVTVANSLGVRAFHKESSAVYSVTVRDKDGFGWAEAPAFDAGEIDFDRLDRTAMEKARLSRAPRSIKPGPYTVILEPAAAADLLFYLGFYGFGAQFYQEGQSFVSGKLGRKVMSPEITLEDDALGGLSAGMPFDYEGLPRQKVTLIESGVARAVAHDRKTAARAGTRTTGHALPPPNTYGPVPINLSLAKGSVSLKEMIRNTERGILVTNFHYTNLLKPLTVEITGMTRNGTFMIKNGRIAYPVRNMRFTESAVEAFNRIEAVGDKQEAFIQWGRVAAPALKIRGFNFSSSTEF
ncbi:MAG: TldD/PmbA family protein [Elusimicrobiales bacterium]|jgi:predicted Zn-dependent protease